jgi:hypothetical protein
MLDVLSFVSVAIALRVASLRYRTPLLFLLLVIIILIDAEAEPGRNAL